MSRPSVDRSFCVSRLAVSRGLSLVALAALVVLAVGVPASAATSPAERTEVLKHFEILDLSDRVVLRPLATESRLPQIELPDDSESAIVSGRELDAGEVSAAYGPAGAEVVATLLRLEPAARRAALGLSPRQEASEEEPAAPAPPVPPAVPALPAHDGRASDARVAFGHGVTIEADERADEVVCIAGSVRVLGEVMGNAVAIGGSNRVSGKVYGDVVAIGGSVHLSETAEVYGEAVAVGGTVHRAPGAKVLGKVTEVAVGDALLRSGDGASIKVGTHDDHSWFDGVFDLIKRLIGIALLALLVCIVLLVAPRLADETGERVRSEVWSAGLIGLLAELLFVPMLVLLVLVLLISIIGIPLLLLVPFLLVAVVIAALVGFTGVATSVGRWVSARWGRSPASPYAAAVLGILAIQSLSILGDLLDLGGGVVGFLGTVVSLLGFAARFIAWTIGLGAVLLGVFALRRRGAAERFSPPPPPPSAGAAVEPAPDRTVTAEESPVDRAETAAPGEAASREDDGPAAG